MSCVACDYVHCDDCGMDVRELEAKVDHHRAVVEALNDAMDADAKYATSEPSASPELRLGELRLAVARAITDALDAAESEEE